MTAAYEPPKTPIRMTLDEYFEFIKTAEGKYEFREGEVVDMSGGSIRHSRIISNLNRGMGNRLDRSPCFAFDSNLCIRNKKLAVYSYPDISVICGDVIPDPDCRFGEAACNPTLMMEVLSPSTEAYDRGKKFERAMTIDTLQEYIIVDQNQPHVELRYRQPDGRWAMAFTEGVHSILTLQSIAIELPLSEVYAGVVFPPSESVAVGLL